MILGALAILMLLPVHAQIAWKQVEPGVWKGVVGTPEDYSLLDVAAVTPLKESFARLPEVALPALANEIVGSIQDGKTSLRIPLQKKEQLYGFGLNFQTVHQRGKILNLHVDHYGGKDNGRTHAPVPFYISSLGYGVFINSARYLTVYAGSGARKDSPNAPVAKGGQPVRIRMLCLFLFLLQVLKFTYLQDLLQWMSFGVIIYSVVGVHCRRVGGWALHNVPRNCIQLKMWRKKLMNLNVKAIHWIL